MKVDPAPVPPPVKGFRFSGVHGGLKKRGRRDFALIVADKPAVCATIFTRNSAVAAPVVVAREHAADGKIQAVMVNSGNANAATGDKGLRFARWSCRELASGLGIDEKLVLPCSTGVIGIQLEKTPFGRAISLGIDGLSKKGFGAAGRAIMTSDAFPKWTHRSVKVGDHELQVAAMAKGAGMIEPNMATMLCFVVTDALISRRAAQDILEAGACASFNRVTVDGDTSTNDTCALLASGAAPGSGIEGASSPGYAELAEAVADAMDELSRMIIRDGEGATKVVDVTVEGAGSVEAADRMARSIASSVLFKCALAGADPNWGRIVMALGNSGVAFDAAKITVHIDNILLVRDGELVSDRASRSAAKIMRKPEFTVRVGVGKGPEDATVVTSDLTTDYVHFNSAYTS